MYKKAVDKQLGQARKAMFTLFRKARILRLPVDIILELFDKTVVPILLYGVEIWGVEGKLREIEVFHRQFLRMLLGVCVSTPNCMLHGETGAYSIELLVRERIINFWAIIVSGNQSKLSAIMYKLICKLHVDQNCDYNSRWIDYVKRILDHAGFSKVWSSKCWNPKWLKCALKLRFRDMFRQDWNSQVHENSMCNVYRIFKTEFVFEKYLNCSSLYRTRLAK